MGRSIEAPPERRSAHLLRIETAFGLVVIDLLAISIGFGLVTFLADRLADPKKVLLACMMFGFTYLIFAFYGRAFSYEVVERVSKSMNRSIAALFAAVAILCVIAFLVRPETGWENRQVIFSIIGAGVLIVLFRWVFEKAVSQKVKTALFDRIMIVDGLDISPIDGFRIIDARQQAIEPNGSDPMMRHWAALFLQDADCVVVACRPERQREWIKFLRGSNVYTELLMPELNDLGAISVSHRGRDTSVAVSDGCLSRGNRFVKRLFDVILAVFLSVPAIPIVAMCAILIKIDDGGPIFFRQQRVGRGNRLFEVIKLRTMGVGHVGITRIGKYLRASSVDELPQIYNVITGQMSLVGPRPHALDSQAGSRFFWEIEEKYWHRHAIKPGITGLAQVRGYRGATSEGSDLSDRLQCDLEYLRGWSLWRDMAILVATTRVLFHKNAR